MDKDKLVEKLNQIADWTYPSVSNETAIERIIPANGAKDYRQNFTPKEDLGPRIIRLKNCLRPCEWCGKILEHKKNITKQTVPRRGDSPEIIKWHISCYNCQRVWDPIKGELQAVSKSIETRRKNKINKSVSDEK